MHQIPVHRELFNRAMSRIENRHARGFVNSETFHTDEAVRDDVDLSDSIAATDGEEGFHESASAELLAVRGYGYLDWRDRDRYSRKELLYNRLQKRGLHNATCLGSSQNHGQTGLTDRHGFP